MSKDVLEFNIKSLQLLDIQLKRIDVNADNAIIQSYKQIIQIRIYVYGLNLQGTSYLLFLM